METKLIGDMKAVVFVESDLNGKLGDFYPFLNLTRLSKEETPDAKGVDLSAAPLWDLAVPTLDTGAATLDRSSDAIINDNPQLEVSMDLVGGIEGASGADDPEVLVVNLPPGVRLGSDFTALFILQLIQDLEVPINADEVGTEEGKAAIKKIAKSVSTGAAKQGVPGAAQVQAGAEDSETDDAEEEAADNLGNGGADADDGAEATSSRRKRRAVAWVGSLSMLTALGWGLYKAKK